MEKNKITLNGRETTLYQKTDSPIILNLIEGEGNFHYKDNPTVAAIVNGKLCSLREKISERAKIESVHLFSPFGKRVYRKSLCFLLSYASELLYPDKTLVIGHSLGDGFYFSYRDGFKADANKLKEVMKEAVKKTMPINIVTLREEDAREYITHFHLIETEKLLNSRGDSIYQFARLGDTLELYYEPMLPSTKYLEVWDLMEYRDGLLLRYPQSRNYSSIMPFVDNPLLFSVFKENKIVAKNLNIESLGALNEKVVSGNISESILLAEAIQRRRIAEIAEEIKSKGSVKSIFIAGPSSSGKTTFSLKLSLELKAMGYKPIKISLDDYYHTTEDIPLDESGNRDYEVLEALKLELFREQIMGLVRGEEVKLAHFNFKTKKTSLEEMPTKMDEKSILIVEGIHGLNPKLVPELNPKYSFKIYISALTQLNLDSRSRISTTDNRILRRMVRDARTRGFNAVETLSRWPSVERGEKNHIFPNQNNADVMINSSLEYELGVLAVYAIPLLRSVKKEEGDSYTTARRLLSFLELVYPISSEFVPPDSLLREFIGGSIWNAT